MKKETCPIPDYSNIPKELLKIPKKYKNIVIVGASHNPERPSYMVMDYLLKEGFNVIPVNPAREEILGKKVYTSLSDLPPDFYPEVIIIFRRSDQVLPIVKEAIKLRPKVIWMQEGIINEEAKNLAEKEGIKVVMNMCFKKVHLLSKKNS
ncbi:MAG: CoA-binding protein [Thermodesulfobacterium geofontis]|uniref:CoA-binding protein n=3 Tax=Thermodesulfobacterium geofontis TaxID=1295609 RepID=A0A2N7PN38_9BACT|nr:MAG: CoA-binding protein [Thermodesulfobacterium geofontis]